MVQIELLGLASLSRERTAEPPLYHAQSPTVTPATKTTNSPKKTEKSHTDSGKERSKRLPL